MSGLVQVINSGSSSIKYSLIDVANTAQPVVWAEGVVEAIGESGSQLTHRTRIGRGATADFDTSVMIQPLPDHAAGFAAIDAAFVKTGPVSDVGELAAYGHRVVHGGDVFAAPALIDDDVIAAITTGRLR